MAKIEFENKTSLRNSDIPEINKLTAANINEIKESVNNLYDNPLSAGRVYKAVISQSGTNPIELDVITNTTGYTIGSTYGVQGAFTLTGFEGLQDSELEINFSKNLSAGCDVRASVVSPTTILVNTYNSSGVLTNDILTGRSGGLGPIQVITITFLD
jgi:hypothetical protein